MIQILYFKNLQTYSKIKFIVSQVIVEIYLAIQEEIWNKNLSIQILLYTGIIFFINNIHFYHFYRVF